MPAPPSTIAALASSVRNRQSSAEQAVTSCLEEISRANGPLNAFREVYADEAIAAAQAIDAKAARGEDPGQLAGVPIALKDNIVTDFGRTSCGSRMLEEFRSPYTATAVRRLTNAGAIVIGKTNCDEFAMGSSTENCAFGAVKNPWDVKRVPGGSSGGSAAAVAAQLCPVALGSDTGGSVRQPAAMCGVVGVKPSYGRVSRYGLVAFGSSLDQIGPLARCVEDAAAILQVMAGVDRRDSTSSDAPVPDYLAHIGQPIEGLRIGVPREYLSDDNDPAVNDAVRHAIEVYKSMGATIIDLTLPLTQHGLAVYYIIAPAEASSNLARFDGIRYGTRAAASPVHGTPALRAGPPSTPGSENRVTTSVFDLYARSRAEGFGREVQRRIMLGTYVLSAGYYEAYYHRALQVRRLIKQEFDAAFARCHAILGPTSPTPAFAIGEKADPLTMYLSDIYTVNTSIAGICGISIPCGFAQVNGTRLPIGLQLQCKAFDEATMFRIARMFEKAHNV